MAMTEVSSEVMKKLAEAFNREFGEPFLPKDHVVARVEDYEGKPILALKIGKRDVEINSAMEVTSAGTAIGYPGAFNPSR